MLLQQQKMQLSAYSGLYDLIVPQENLLRKINELIDFSFIYEELLSKYCLSNGRNAERPRSDVQISFVEKYLHGS